MGTGCNALDQVYTHFMCGRFAQPVPKKWVEETFGFTVPDDYQLRYNVSPATESLVVQHDTARLLKWGLVPHWAKDATMGARMINARSETLFDKPAFRDAVRTSRCLIPAKAFYEWQQTDMGKQPHAIGSASSNTLVMAGITSSWLDRETGEALDTFAILTCPPTKSMATIHNRMPVILESGTWDNWVDPAATTSQLSKLLAPCPDATIRIWPVSSAVNNITAENANLLNPVEIIRQASLL